MYDAGYFASMGIDDSIGLMNSAPPYMDSGLSGAMEGAFGGADMATPMSSGYGGMGGAPGMAGGAGMFSPIQKRPPQFAAGKLDPRPTASPRGVPGNFQMLPDRDLGKKPGDIEQIGLRGREAGVVRAGTEPTGTSIAPGSQIKNNYSKLRHLSNAGSPMMGTQMPGMPGMGAPGMSPGTQGPKLSALVARGGQQPPRAGGWNTQV